MALTPSSAWWHNFNQATTKPAIRIRIKMPIALRVEVINNSSISGTTLTLATNSPSVVLTIGTTFAVGSDAEETAVNMSNYINKSIQWLTSKASGTKVDIYLAKKYHNSTGVADYDPTVSGTALTWLTATSSDTSKLIKLQDFPDYLSMISGSHSIYFGDDAYVNPNNILSFSTSSASIDALSRQFSISDVEVSVLDDGFLRQVLKGGYLNRALVQIYLGSSDNTNSPWLQLPGRVLKSFKADSISPIISLSLSDPSERLREMMWSGNVYPDHPLNVAKEIFDYFGLDYDTTTMDALASAQAHLSHFVVFRANTPPPIPKQYLPFRPHRPIAEYKAIRSAAVTTKGRFLLDRNAEAVHAYSSAEGSTVPITEFDPSDFVDVDGVAVDADDRIANNYSEYAYGDFVQHGQIINNKPRLVQKFFTNTKVSVAIETTIKEVKNDYELSGLKGFGNAVDNESVYDIMQGLAATMHGTFYFDVDNKIKFAPLSLTASSILTLDCNTDVSKIEVIEEGSGNIINQATATFNTGVGPYWKDESFTLTQLTSNARFGQLFDFSIDLQWLNSFALILNGRGGSDYKFYVNRISSSDQLSVVFDNFRTWPSSATECYLSGLWGITGFCGTGGIEFEERTTTAGSNEDVTVYITQNTSYQNNTSTRRAYLKVVGSIKPNGTDVIPANYCEYITPTAYSRPSAFAVKVFRRNTSTGRSLYYGDDYKSLIDIPHFPFKIALFNAANDLAVLNAYTHNYVSNTGATTSTLLTRLTPDAILMAPGPTTLQPDNYKVSILEDTTTLVDQTWFKLSIDTSYSSENFSSGRGGLGGSTAKTWHGWPGAAFPDNPDGFYQAQPYIVDVTIPRYVTQQILRRFAFGCPVLSLTLPLRYAYLEVGDVISLSNLDFYLVTSRDGMQSNDTWEITKTSLRLDDSPGVDIEVTLLKKGTELVTDTGDSEYVVETVPTSVVRPPDGVSIGSPISYNKGPLETSTIKDTLGAARTTVINMRGDDLITTNDGTPIQTSTDLIIRRISFTKTAY